MEELVKVIKDPNGGIVDARELHLFLEVKSDFNNWIKNRIKEYGFVEGLDFMVFVKSYENPKGGRPMKEYNLSLNMAKELAMVERSEKGRMARQYFIEIEKRYRSGVSIANVQLIREAVAIAGSQAKLAKRIGVSEGGLSDAINGHKQLSYGYIKKIEHLCTRVVQHGFAPNPEVFENLMKVEDKEVRLSLYETMKKGGLL